MDAKTLAVLTAAADQPPDVSTDRLLARLSRNRDLVLFIIAALIFLFFSLTTITFLREFNLLNILRNTSLITIVAVGMTFVLIAGEIDLSVGSAYGVLTVLMGMLVVAVGLSPWLAMPIVILAGAAVGLFNGLFIVGFGIPSFIVTLAMLAGFRSLALIISGERPFTPRGTDVFYDLTGGNMLLPLGEDRVLHVPWLIIWMIPVVVIGGIVLAYTRFGYHVYATGGNREAARDTGINVARVRLSVFVLTSALCGLAAALVFGYLHAAAPTTGVGFEFRVIGAVVVGGTALTGGRGSILGTLLGAVIIGMITGGMVLFGYSQNVGDMATGLLIMVVGSLDLGLRRHLRSRAW
ncbi:MAG: ABC transporter permease [Methylobacteriaceae bacterium]|nr:ABC transporter permease [Methylobacteriaceae bacterium]